MADEEEGGGEDGWVGAIQKTAAGVEMLVIFMGGYADAVPFGSAVSIVTAHIKEARELQRLAQEKADKMLASIKRTEKTLSQMEENQLTDKSKHKPVENLLKEYASLLGRVDKLVDNWNHLHCMQQMCFSSSYNDQFEELTELLAALKSDLTLSTIAKMDAEARINAMETQSKISDADANAQARHEETEIKLTEAAAVQEETRAYVMELKELVENSVTTNAMTLEMTNEWDRILAFDWTAKSVGVVTDACRAIRVGVVDQAESPQLLLLQFYDTEEQYDYRGSQYSSGGIIGGQRPTWAMSMKAQEMRAVRSAFLKEAKPAPVMIHEEPLLDDQEWYARAWWLPSHKDGCLGMRLEVKASQDVNPTVHFILFALQGDLFRKVGPPKDETVAVDNKQQLLEAYLAAKDANPLPAMESVGLDTPLVFSSEKKPIKTDYQPEGDSPLELEIDGGGGTTFHTQARKTPDNLFQHLVSGKITLRNHSDEDVRIRSVKTEVKEPGGDFEASKFTPDYYATQDTYVGFYKGSYMNWGIPHPEVSQWIEEGQEFVVPAKDKVDVVVKAIWVIENAKEYNGKPLNMRVHASMQDPVTIKATFVQESGETKSICWDFANEVMEDRSFTNYEELLEMKGERDTNVPLWKERRLQEIGEDFQCDLWLHVDDPETLKRYYIVVTSARESPKQWVVRAGSTSDKFPSNHHNVRPKDLERMAFDAKREGETKVKTSWTYDSKHCLISALVDLERQVVYGLEAEITLKDGAIRKKAAMYFESDRF